MWSTQTDAKPVCLQGCFFLMLESIVKLSRPPKVLFGVQLAGMQLAVEMEIRLERKCLPFAQYANLRVPKIPSWRIRKLHFAEVFPHTPPTGMLPQLFFLCLLVAAHSFSSAVIRCKSRTSCSASPLPPYTHLARLWVAYGFDVGLLVNDTLCGACEWSHC